MSVVRFQCHRAGDAWEVTESDRVVCVCATREDAELVRDGLNAASPMRASDWRTAYRRRS